MLEALDAASKSVDYYVLDLSKSEVERTLEAISRRYHHVQCHGLLGTCKDGLSWLKRSENRQSPKAVVSIGPLIGNLNTTEATDLLADFVRAIGDRDSIPTCLKACQHEERVDHAHNDEKGKTYEFILNGLLHANNLLSKSVLKIQNWQVVRQYNKTKSCHQAFYSSLKNLAVDDIYTSEEIGVEESSIYSTIRSGESWKKADLASPGDHRKFDIHLLSLLAFPTCPSIEAAFILYFL